MVSSEKCKTLSYSDRINEIWYDFAEHATEQCHTITYREKFSICAPHLFQASVMRDMITTHALNLLNNSDVQ